MPQAVSLSPEVTAWEEAVAAWQRHGNCTTGLSNSFQTVSHTAQHGQLDASS